MQKWWGQMDSNHRRHSPADLQSAPFGHSGTPPKFVILLDKELSPEKGVAKVERFFVLAKY